MVRDMKKKITVDFHQFNTNPPPSPGLGTKNCGHEMEKT